MAAPCVGSVIDGGALRLESFIGQGGFAQVYLVRSTTCEEEVYALKVLSNRSKRSKKNAEDTDEDPGPHAIHLNEARLHALCSSPANLHSSITPLLKTIIYRSPTSVHTCLLLPYYPAGDLFTAIITKKAFLGNLRLIKSSFLQILNGVEEAHSKGVFLRDIKPENCLLDGEGRVFICDFGLATDEHLSEEFKTGSAFHMAPECRGPEPYSPRQSDIWSLGVLLLNLVTSRNPWREAKSSDPTFIAYLNSHPYSQAWSPALPPPPLQFHPFQSSHLNPVPSPKKIAPILSSLLPISSKLVGVLHQILHPVPSERMSLEDMKVFFEEMGTDMDSWYCPTVSFDWEGGCARCEWEVEADKREKAVQEGKEYAESVKSSWSRASGSFSGSIKFGGMELARNEGRAHLREWEDGPMDVPSSVLSSPSISLSHLPPVSPELSPSHLSSSSASGSASDLATPPIELSHFYSHPHLRPHATPSSLNLFSKFTSAASKSTFDIPPLQFDLYSKVLPETPPETPASFEASSIHNFGIQDASDPDHPLRFRLSVAPHSTFEEDDMPLPALEWLDARKRTRVGKFGLGGSLRLNPISKGKGKGRNGEEESGGREDEGRSRKGSLRRGIKLGAMSLGKMKMPF